MIKKLVGILVSMLLFATVLSVAGTTNISENRSNPFVSMDIDWWPMFHHDEANSGFSTTTGPNTNHTRWTYHTGSSMDSSPAVVDGKVYVGAIFSTHKQKKLDSGS